MKASAAFPFEILTFKQSSRERHVTRIWRRLHFAGLFNLDCNLKSSKTIVINELQNGQLIYVVLELFKLIILVLSCKIERASFHVAHRVTQEVSYVETCYHTAGVSFVCCSRSF